jgi:predicted phosphohydrolase
MKLAWCTDIHINFLKDVQRDSFYDTLREYDGVLISGDIAEAPSLVDTMVTMENIIQKPIYFVLGNHDYYNGSIADVRKKMKDLRRGSQFIRYLPDRWSIFNDGILIAGLDGWADTRYGDISRSHVCLNDERYIKDLRDHITAVHYGKDRTLRQWAKREELADADANWFYEQVTDVLDQKIVPISRVIILTHIPPFPEVSKHRGVQSTNDYLPFYASKATGDVLLKLAEQYPNITFEVFCGHTHGEAMYKAKSNMIVKAGESEYFAPRINGIVEI